jgi:hypothetical protein
MKIGLSLIDDDKTRTLAEKVERAAALYVRKYGVKPNCCHVNLGDFKAALISATPRTSGKESNEEFNGVAVHGSMAQRPNYLWIGVSDDQTNV